MRSRACAGNQTGVWSAQGCCAPENVFLRSSTKRRASKTSGPQEMSCTGWQRIVGRCMSGWCSTGTGREAASSIVSVNRQLRCTRPRTEATPRWQQQGRQGLIGDHTCGSCPAMLSCSYSPPLLSCV